MSKRINEAFLTEYMELDKICCEKFGVSTGGATEYINRLTSARFAPCRDDILPRLIDYRNMRNKLAHEVDALRRSDELTKADLKWLNTFCKDITKKKDPISIYLRKARSYARRRKARNILLAVFGVLVVAAAVAIYYLATK